MSRIDKSSPFLQPFIKCVTKMEGRKCRLKSQDSTAEDVFYTKKYTIIPLSYMRWMRIFGLFPYPTTFLHNNDSRTSQRYRMQRIMWLIWSVFFLFCLFLFFLMQEYDYFRRVSSLLTDLEFFTLIAFDFKSVMILQGPYVVFCMLFIGSSIPQIVSDSQNALRRLLRKRDMIALRRYTILLFICAVVSVGVSVIAKLLGLQALTKANYFTANETSPYFFGHLHVFPEVHYTTQLLGIFLTVSCEMLPFTMLLIFLLHFKVGFEKLNRKADEWAKREAEFDVRHLRQLFRVYCGLTGTVRKLGSTFGPLLLVGCLKDVFTWAALSGTLLQVEKAEWKESDKFLRALTYIRSMEIVTYTYTAVGLCNMVMRLGVFLIVYDKAQSIRKHITNIAADSEDEEILIECNKITIHFSPSDGAVSVCGLFDLTREYVIAFIGLAVTYLLLIYQTRDSRKDIEGMKETLKRQELLIHLLINATKH